MLSRILAHGAVLIAVAPTVGCGGNEFASCMLCGDDAATGASGAGGSTAPDGAGGGAQPDVASAGAAGAQEAGTGLDAAREFPKTPLLDAFNRADGALGPNWLGNTGTYRVRGQRLEYASGPGHAVLWYAPFGSEQEVFATLAAIDETQPEINIVMKAQELSDCELLEVMYAPNEELLRFNYCTAGQWSELSQFLPPGAAA